MKETIGNFRVHDLKLIPLSPSLPQSSCSQKCTKKSALHLAEDLFIASEATSRAGRETLPYLDDDIPLLSVEEEPGMCLLCCAFRGTMLSCPSWSFSCPCSVHLLLSRRVSQNDAATKVVGRSLSSVVTAGCFEIFSGCRYVLANCFANFLGSKVNCTWCWESLIATWM